LEGRQKLQFQLLILLNEPSGTQILGAAKINWQAYDGWNIGAIQAVTKREYADYQVDGQQYSLESRALNLLWHC